MLAPGLDSFRPSPNVQVSLSQILDFSQPAHAATSLNLYHLLGTVAMAWLLRLKFCCIHTFI